ncbi:hypothetical protein [Ponticoccus alexandrii]|uniref:Uncharacterized protein n=1 Tax=Ponticoccus alexandrii TaxID=1943633 RepID=A0ABX7F9X7_9RHOB|nr:hypothetical protein [Ponticoccus alexandrii]ETA54004.1 hypothetical protein P279_00205 [Rhodobacteraceae bacterium PD-2]QRF66354.1 hypothetical protein GQA70_08555 [Ponticoccus alexandrii]
MKRDLDTFPPSQQAGILCGQERFREFAASRLQIPGAVSSAAAGEFVRRECDVTSRADLDHYGDAAARWQTLRTEYDAWRGRIPAQQGR